MRYAGPYRIPPNPGFIGAYNWRAMIAGFVLLFLWNVAATQLIASKFAYQRALGTPIYRTSGFALYQPFAWSIWVLRYAGSEDPRVRFPAQLGLLTISGGCIPTIVLFFMLNTRRVKRLSRNSEDVHGSARWATEEDIRRTGLLDARKGVYVGGWWNAPDRRLHYLRHDGPEHVLAFAPTRSGKGVGLVIPTLLTWSESTVVYDIKGENWAKTAGFRAQQGHLCFKFSPVEERGTSRFNPLAELRLFTARDVSDAQNVADMIVRTGEDSPQERYWQDAAASITTGMILHVCYAAAADGRFAALADLARVCTTPGTNFRETLYEIMSYPHDPSLAHDWKTANGEPSATHPVVREKVQEMLDKEDKDFSGVLSTAKTALTLSSDPLVARNTSVSDFTIQDLVNHERPISLYLVVPPSDKIRLRPLIRLIFTMIVNRLTERMDFQGATQRRNKHRLLFLIDEFPSLKRMELFADALSYMAGYGLKAYLITQDIRQILDQYGVNESIVSNCHIRIAYAPNQLETAEVLSRMTGTKTVQKASFNFSGSRLAPIMGHVNATVDHIERPLMTPDEILRLTPARKQRFGDSERIVAPGQMLIFVSGQHPILGTQLLYFSDPVLSRRAQIYLHQPICIRWTLSTTVSPRPKARWKQLLWRNSKRPQKWLLPSRTRRMQHPTQRDRQKRTLMRSPHRDLKGAMNVIDDIKIGQLWKDAGWRGALTILLGSQQLSNDGRVWQHIDLNREEIQFARILKDGTLSSGERTLLEIATSLFNQTLSINLWQAFSRLDDRSATLAVTAICNSARLRVLEDPLTNREINKEQAKHR